MVKIAHCVFEIVTINCCAPKGQQLHHVLVFNIYAVSLKECVLLIRVEGIHNI